MPQKTYYSSVGGLIVNIFKGRRVTDEGGISKMVDQKIAEFTPQGDGYGVLTTEDEQTIAVLDQRMTKNMDVFDAREYSRRTTPPEVRLRLLEQEHERVVEDRNRLATKLAEEGRLAAAKK